MDLYSIADGGERQTADTIRIMRAFSLDGAVQPAIVALCAALAAGRDLRYVSAHQRNKEWGNAVWAWVHRHCAFVPDEDLAADVERHAGGEPVYEILYRPVDMLRNRAGDCDDFACLVAAMLTCLGVPNGFVTVAADGSAPQEFSHVYNAVLLDGDTGGARWALDASHGTQPGWEAPNRFNLRWLWPVWGCK